MANLRLDLFVMQGAFIVLLIMLSTHVTLVKSVVIRPWTIAILVVIAVSLLGVRVSDD